MPRCWSKICPSKTGVKSRDRGMMLTNKMVSIAKHWLGNPETHGFLSR